MKIASLCLISIILAILKLTGMINLSWWVILIPIFIIILVGIILIISGLWTMNNR